MVQHQCCNSIPRALDVQLLDTVLHHDSAQWFNNLRFRGVQNARNSNVNVDNWLSITFR